MQQTRKLKLIIWHSCAEFTKVLPNIYVPFPFWGTMIWMNSWVYKTHTLMEDQALVQSQLPDGTASYPTGFEEHSLGGLVSPNLLLFCYCSLGPEWTSSHQCTSFVLYTGWAAFLHSAPDGVHHRPYFFCCWAVLSFFFFFFGCFFSGPDLHIAILLTFLHS